MPFATALRTGRRYKMSPSRRALGGPIARICPCGGEEGGKLDALEWVVRPAHRV